MGFPCFQTLFFAKVLGQVLFAESSNLAKRPAESEQNCQSKQCFFLYDRSPFVKNVSVFDKVYQSLYGRPWKNPVLAQTSVLKSQFFSTGDQSYKNKYFIFQFLSVVGVYLISPTVIKGCSLCSILIVSLAIWMMKEIKAITLNDS